jgi:peptidoglycan-associated lipoprotein
MRQRRHMNFGVAGKCFVVAVQFLTLAACSTAPATKPPETTAMQQQNKVPVAKQVKPVAANSSSSLEANREGKPPASGPLKDIYFEFDQYNLRADARDLLKTHAGWLKNNAAAQVEIEGHCDDRGTDEYNLALGAKRAQTAKDYLVTLGVPSSRITTISYGKELPVCRDQTEECWQRNRHDRFVVKNLPTA